MGTVDAADDDAAAATCSIVNEETLLSMNGTPVEAAALAVASSPSAWRIPCTPTGARRNGAGYLAPNKVMPMSRPLMSRGMTGRILRRLNASRLARIVSPPPAPPATYQ